MPTPINLALIGDRDLSVRAHAAIEQLPVLFSEKLELELRLSWHATASLGSGGHSLAQSDWIWCVPGSPYQSAEGALTAIRYAREHGIPFLGTCGGFQYALIEYARNILGLLQADHCESNPGTNLPIVASLHCALRDRASLVTPVPGTFLYSAIEGQEIEELYNCSFGLNRNYRYLFEHTALVFSAFDRSGLPHAFELQNHTLFLGVLFQPELRALERKIHPLLEAFAVSVRKEERLAAVG
ncbi:MAG: hypothetical protein K1X83_03405 [Oligoflexia bacterium]|nr:hypothetical protein [Oligoflexia bacterium]